WRLTEMQSAIGRIQLTRMPEWHAKRVQYAEQLWNAARALPALRVPAVPDDIQHAAYKCYVFVRPEQLADGWSRDRILDEIVARVLPCFEGSWSEVYLENVFDGTVFRSAESLPIARELAET